MQRSRTTPRHRTLARLPLTAAIYLAFGSAFAQDAQPATQDQTTTPAPQQKKTAELETVTVTAQKRTEDVQKVPISIQVLGKEKLDELNLVDFRDYAQYV